jgi:hypothetical protein
MSVAYASIALSCPEIMSQMSYAHVADQVERSLKVWYIHTVKLLVLNVSTIGNGSNMKTRMPKGTKELITLGILIALTVLLSWPLVTANLLYPEQAIFYNANQLIHSFSDLINVIMHPRLFNVAVPFARPSSNFLLYQLITPLLGWHNLAGLVIVNLTFLGIVGYLLLKLYQEFFPGMVAGGYLAFSFYLMHPGMILTRRVIMNFDFSYIACVLLSILVFVRFVKKNLPVSQSPTPLKFTHTYLLLIAIFFYFLAVTLKESAVMLGPVLGTYFLIAFYQRDQLVSVFKNKEKLSIFMLLGIVSVAAALYLSLAYGGYGFPVGRDVGRFSFFKVVHNFIGFLLCSAASYVPEPVSAAVKALGPSQIPTLTQYVLWALLIISGVSIINIFLRATSVYKKPLLYLLTALLMFMIIPLVWGQGFPWHLSLSFACEALILGFGVEFYLRHRFSKTTSATMVILLSAIIAFSAYQVDKINPDLLKQDSTSLGLKLNYNSIAHPPLIRNQLNDQSILVVQDNADLGDYLLGNAAYPAIVINQNQNFNFDDFGGWGQKKIFFWRVQPIYNGTLFRWAYLLPDLKEELVPFKDNDMRLVSDTILRSWISHLNNIFCLTYDSAGNWFDNTSQFKKNIILEQSKRHLVINKYNAVATTALSAKLASMKKLPYADPELCQTYCDSLHSCKGFTFVHVTKAGKNLAQCLFYNRINAAHKPCPVCTAFFKMV